MQLTREDPVNRFSTEKGAKHGPRRVLDQLGVKDLEPSRTFYEKFGFKVFAGDASQSWLIMKNGDHVIGLFQGLFEKNILTFNPGWDSNPKRQAVLFDVYCPDIVAFRSNLVESGVEAGSLEHPFWAPRGEFRVKDPDGYVLVVTHT